ncbi:MAG: lipocalin-like domain-containing protein [Pseudomonadota bacterium]
MNDTKKPFVGVWEITNWTVTNLESGEVVQFFDGEYAGNIIYTEAGWVSASLMDKRRPDVSNDRAKRYRLGDLVSASGLKGLSDKDYEYLAPFVLSAMGYVGYMGTFDADDDTVYHKTTSAGRPNHAGITLPRHYEFSDGGNRLKLWADAFGFRDTLIWTRVG